MELQFDGLVIYWRGPSPFYFVPIPDEQCDQISAVAHLVTYGWGVIPVRATIGGTEFTTSLFPKDGAYLLPLKNAVRLPQHLDVDDLVSVRLTIDI